MSMEILFSSTMGHVPLLAVLIVGFVLLSARGKRLGARSVLFARLGLGLLALGSVLGIAWTVLIPTLYSSLDYSITRYHLLISGIGLVTALLSAGGIGLLIAAVLSRGPGPAFTGGPPTGWPPAGGPSYPAGPPADGPPPHAGQAYSVDPGQPYGAGDQSTEPPVPR